MDDDLKPRSIKIGSDRWARWMEEAKARKIPLTALIIERMDAPTPPGVRDEHVRLDHAIVTLTEERDEARAKIIQLNTRIVELVAALDRRPTQETVASIQAEAAAFTDEVATLKRDLAKRPIEAVAQRTIPPQVHHPRDIDGKVHHVSGPILADPVPRAVVGEAKPFFRKNQKAALNVAGQEKEEP